jgi:CubicO group peptidase (beta-lactamase class C family)
MTDTGFTVSTEARGRLAQAYKPDGQGMLRPDTQQRDRSIAPAFLSGGGGLVGTTSDYARYCQALLTDELLGHKTIELMTANHWTGGASPFPAGFPTPRGYGFGLGVRTLLDVAQSGMPSSVGEFGWGGAYGTYFWIDPHEALIGIFMVQLVPGNFRPAHLFQVLTYQALIA